jgi:hypothetical protein
MYTCRYVYEASLEGFEGKLVAKERRKPNSIHTRMYPCICCAHPISQRHHLLPFADYGENDYTVQICANCHEIFHLLDNFANQTTRPQSVSNALKIKNGETNTQRMFQYIVNRVDRHIIDFLSRLVDASNELKYLLPKGEGTISEKVDKVPIDKRKEYMDAEYKLHELLYSRS